MWPMKDEIIERQFIGHKGPVTCITFSTDDLQLISGSADMTIKIWIIEN